MSPLQLSQVLAQANASMVEPDLDVTGALSFLLKGAAEALPVDAAAVLVKVQGRLELLAATSHQASMLELYQRQADQGPCLEVIRSENPVTAVGAEAMTTRWPLVGPAIEDAGYQAVHGTPLRWQGRVFGALNLFRSSPDDFESDAAACQALADSLTLVLLAAHPAPAQLQEGLQAALEERAIVEQAKGALAYVRSIDMAAAYDALLDLAHTEGVSLGVAARRVMERARTSTLEPS